MTIHDKLVPSTCNGSEQWLYV